MTFSLKDAQKAPNQKCLVKSWALKTHLQKVWTFFSLIKKKSDSIQNPSYLSNRFIASFDFHLSFSCQPNKRLKFPLLLIPEQLLQMHWSTRMIQIYIPYTKTYTNTSHTILRPKLVRSGWHTMCNSAASTLEYVCFKSVMMPNQKLGLKVITHLSILSNPKSVTHLETRSTKVNYKLRVQLELGHVLTPTIGISKLTW